MRAKQSIKRSSPRMSPLRTGLICVFSLVSMCSFVGSSAYAQSRLQFTLAPGQFAVGFKAVDLFDRTREFGERTASVDHAGGTHGRPLQVSIWYPAQPATNATRMRVREYAELTSLPGELPRRDAAGRAAALGTFMRSFGGTDTARVQRELNAITAAVRDAASAHGPFPIVVYGPSLGALSYENSVLCEFLASHGYIVVASPSWGASGGMTTDLEGIETQARDMEYLIAYGRTLPNVQMSRMSP